MGLAEVISVQFLPAVYKDIVAFAILIVMLIVKPTGIWAAAAERTNYEIGWNYEEQKQTYHKT
jgi:branched-subunit amino acid ABC-type transport system permease component